MPHHTRQNQQARRTEHGQAIVEFAILITILSLVFLGVVDYSRFLYYNLAITSAARVGAEMASNHCISAYMCEDPNTFNSPVADTYVLWATSCEAAPTVQLAPAYTSCSPAASASWVPSCSGTCTNCAQDICVTPSNRTTGSAVTVAIGYNFHPISPFLDWVFTNSSAWTQGCFTGDSPHTHTICASSTGRVSG